MSKWKKKRGRKARGKNVKGVRSGKFPTLSLSMIVKNEEEYLAQCLHSVKSIVDLHYNLGTFLKNQGRNDEAIGEFQKTLSINPEVAEAHFSSDFLFFKKGDYVKAKNSFKRVLGIDHLHETARKNLEVLEKMGVA